MELTEKNKKAAAKIAKTHNAKVVWVNKKGEFFLNESLAKSSVADKDHYRLAYRKDNEAQVQETKGKGKAGGQATDPGTGTEDSEEPGADGKDQEDGKAPKDADKK